MSVLFPYKQDSYNMQVLDLLNMYENKKIVFWRGDSIEENRFCVEQILLINFGEKWIGLFSQAAIDSAVRIIMSKEGTLPAYRTQLYKNRQQLGLEQFQNIV